MAKLVFDSRAAYIDEAAGTLCFSATEPGHPPVYFAVKVDTVRALAGQSHRDNPSIPALWLYDAFATSIHSAAARAFERAAVVEGVHIISAEDFRS